MNRTLPRFPKRTRTGNPESPRTGRRLLPHAEELDRPIATAAEILAGPLAPTRRRHGRRYEVLERVIGAHAAVVTRCPPAVRKAVLVQRGLPVLPEEIAMQPGRDVIPGQDLIGGAVPCHVPVGVEALGCHRVEPAAEVEALAPLLERPAVPPDAFDDATDAPVAPARDPLDERRRRVVPAELDAGLADRAAQQPDLALQLVDTVLAEPLERCVRLGHETADRRRATGLLRVLATDLDDVARQLGDATRVFVHLGRHAGEEVQLHAPPALRIRAVDRGIQVVLGDELVEDLADPPRAALGREREPGAADLLDLAGDAAGERVDAHRR